MPRSRSRSLESIARSATRWFSRKAPDCCSSRSTSVVLPWSTWAMIATLRSFIQEHPEINGGPVRGPRFAGNIVIANKEATDAALTWRCRNARFAPWTTGKDSPNLRYDAAVGGDARRRSSPDRWRGVGWMRSAVRVRNKRRVLCIFPAYTPSFGTFSHAYQADAGGARLHAAAGPAPDRGLYAASPGRSASSTRTSARRPPHDLAWADVVLVSRHAHPGAADPRHPPRARTRPGKVVVLGGPSASASPEMYPEIDYLHIGETRRRHRPADRRRSTRASRAPPAQVRFKTEERLPLPDFPIPAYDLIPLKRYLMLTLQFSSGCPYRCEFCDIPGLYGRQPRLKTPAQIIAELDAMRSQHGHARRWSISSTTISSATARPRGRCCRTWSRGRSSTAIRCSSPARRRSTSPSRPEILELMREALFLGIFVGIETPEADALKAMRKDHNDAAADDGVRSRRSTTTAWR